jgi:uncharacterized protein
VFTVWIVGAFILLGLWAFWEQQAIRYLKAKDYAKALPLLRIAANTGHAPSMNSLGWLNQNGWGVAQDYGKACDWYQRAADGGNTDAMNNLGLLNQNGWGLKQDYGKAREWYQKAADAGNPFAKEALWRLNSK